ncbi:MAG: kinase/pyrophosphorylase [Candidatus Omnitrophica bacterium]|nr:kinase/pyrophosphorylase [Candidatus Omnitrophota bacterium]MBI2173877.1 kinase/pyrophosphorylase [Candidatus Omnitrophota bacterium]MBI3009836.1 kinase/pyrophosphorylase [Candidatus Omnitrophota bacterium]
MPQPSSEPIPVTLVSDATGSLGQHVLQTIFTQFATGVFSLQVINFVDSETHLKSCLEQLRHTQGLVIHATVYESFKRRIEKVCQEQGLAVYDLTGPIVEFLVRASGQRPEVSHGRLHELTTDYFNRVAAIEYTIAHDDGVGLKTLYQADAVLTGVSRTTKTPTSMVLAMHGLCTANVPLVPELESPQELLEVNPSKVICLTLDSAQLAAFRQVRVEQQLGFDGGYTDREHIQKELEWTRRLSRKRGWALLDVTGRAVEETAARALHLLQIRKSDT